MGTSSARRGPTTGLWRSAKGAATRYLSPAAAGEVSAREVVARYLAALEETPGPGEALAAFRVTRKVAQDLGALWQEVAARGWGLALKDRGLAPLAREPAATAGARGERGVGRERRGPGGGRGPDGAGIGDRTGSSISGPAGAGSGGAAVSGHGAAPASGPGPGGAPGSRGGRLRAAPGRLKPDQGRDRGRRFGGRRPVGASGYPRPMAGVHGLDLGYRSYGRIDAEPGAGRPAGSPLRFGWIGYVWKPAASGRGSRLPWCGPGVRSQQDGFSLKKKPL